MSDFTPAYEFMKPWEEGDVAHPDDPGGATRDGVSLRFLRKIDNALDFDNDNDGDIDADDIFSLSPQQIKNIFYDHFWEDQRTYLIDSQDVANRVFSFSVNMGARQQGRILQRAVNAARGDGYALKVDGVLGPNTRAVTNDIDSNLILPAYRDDTWHVYRWIMDRNPSSRSFEGGWYRRAMV